MRWEDEPWVKLYPRDTLDWLALGWEGQAVWFFVFRKLDSAGVLDLGRRGVRGFAAAIGMPIEIFERGLSACTEDGCLVLNGNVIVMPNYVEAQAARKSDRQRQRESRERARNTAMSQNVTDGHTLAVTKSDETSREIKSCHVSSATVPEEKRVEEKRTEENLSPRAIHGATGTEHVAQASKLPVAYDWLTLFQAAYWKKFGKQYGQGASDAKAQGNLGDLLTSLPDSQRLSDWAVRERMIDEFFARSDARTSTSGWSFSFFVQDFRALTIPPENRTKVEPKQDARADGRNTGPKPFRWKALPGANNA